MAKYYYSRYTIEKKMEHSEVPAKIYTLWSPRFNTPLEDSFDYYSSYTFDKEKGFKLTGTKITRRSGQHPPVGYYVSLSIGGVEGLSSIYKIRNDTKENTTYGYTYHTTDWYTLISKTVEVRGTYVDRVIAENGTYPSNGIQGAYWYSRSGLVNASPTISGKDTNVGDKNSEFYVIYSVNDKDTADTLTVREKINGVTIKTINNAPRNSEQTIIITEEMLFSYPLHTTNTIEIEVDDGKGHTVYRRYTFKRTNTAPKISGQDENLGQKTEGFDITFSATDQENDKMSAKIYINDKLVKIYESITSGQEYIYSLSKLEFVQLNNTDVHKIRIEVQDHNNATALRNYTFTRSLTRIWYAFEKETDIMATQILISPTWSVAEGAEGKVLVCNNAFDEEPTWEDATEQILLERHFNFINTEKTGTSWGIGVQIIINKGTATELSYLAGFGGAFK